MIIIYILLVQSFRNENILKHSHGIRQQLQSDLNVAVCMRVEPYLRNPSKLN